MPESPSDVDIADIDVVELSGKLFAAPGPQHVQLELSLEANVNEETADPMLALVTLNCVLRDADDHTDAESMVVYESTATVLVGVNETPVEQTADTWIDHIVQRAWPYLRGATVGHANRLNAPVLEIPLSPPQSGT